jgi:hypothetical protein
MDVSARLPDFIGIGLAHAGSTWLHWALKEHVGLPSPKKETHFFDWHYERGLDWYLASFAHCRADQPMGEICNYFPSTRAAERIAKHISNCRIICSLRDPVERAYSAYKFALYNGITRDSFERALELVPAMTVGNLYAHHLADWYAKFGEDRVLMIFFEELRQNPQAYLDKVCDFIGIDKPDVASLHLPSKAFNSHALQPRIPAIARRGRRAMNWLRDRGYDGAVDMLDRAGVWKLCFAGRFPPMDPEVEARLRRQYLPQIEELEKMTRCDLSSWKRVRENAQDLKTPLREAPAADIGR